MKDPYRIVETPEAVHTARHATADRRRMLRPVLWLVLIVSTAANGVTSSLGASPVVTVGFGLLSLASAITLTVHHYQHRQDASAN